MEEFDEASRIVQEKVHEDANIFVGLVVNEEMGDFLQITAIATGFGASFDKRSNNLEDVKEDAAKRIGTNVDLDVPTIIRKQQRDSARKMRMQSVDEDEYDIPTFLRKRVD